MPFDANNIDYDLIETAIAYVSEAVIEVEYDGPTQESDCYGTTVLIPASRNESARLLREFGFPDLASYYLRACDHFARICGQ